MRDIKDFYKDTILVFGGSGGLGKNLDLFDNMDDDQDIIFLSSKDCDVTNIESVKNIYNRYPYTNGIIWAVAYNHDGQIVYQKDEEIQKQIDINIKGFTNVLKYGLLALREFGKNKTEFHGYRSIPHTHFISFSSFLSEKSLKGTSIYSASKAYMDSLIKTAAVENAKYNILVNSIQLGYFDAGLTRKLPDELRSGLTEKIPAERLGECQELSHLVNFIINNKYMTGSIIKYDGGISLV